MSGDGDGDREDRGREQDPPRRRPSSPSEELLREARTQWDRSEPGDGTPTPPTAAREPAPELPLDWLPVPEPEEAAPAASPAREETPPRAAPSPPRAERPPRPPERRRPERPQSYTWTTETKEPAPGPRLAAVIAAGFAALLGVALLIGFLIAERGGGGSGQPVTTIGQPSTTMPPEALYAEVLGALRSGDSYVDPGMDLTAGDLAGSVQQALAAGIDFKVAVLRDDPPDGPLGVASGLVDDVPAGTVLVVSATRAGISSTEFESEVLDRALDAGSESTGGDAGYTAAVVEVLVAGVRR